MASLSNRSSTCLGDERQTCSVLKPLSTANTCLSVDKHSHNGRGSVQSVSHNQFKHLDLTGVDIEVNVHNVDTAATSSTLVRLGPRSSVSSMSGMPNGVCDRSVTNKEPACRPQTAWKVFEDHVKQITDDTQMIFFRPDRERNFRSSETFVKVKSALDRETEARKAARLATLRSANDGSNAVGDEEKLKMPLLPRNTGMGKRAWGVIRRNVAEVQQDKKQASADVTFNWNFLCHAVSNMTDMERARQDLYKRYLHQPNSWAEGLSDYPAILDKLEARKKKLLAKSKKRGKREVKSAKGKLESSQEDQTKEADPSRPSARNNVVRPSTSIT